MWKELYSLEYSASHSTTAAPYMFARRIHLLFAKRQRGILRPDVFLVSFHKDLAWMNGTPQK